MVKRKLSASALNLFLRSPRAYYWRYVARLDPVMQSVSTFDHDKIVGILWAAFVERFYQGMEEAENLARMLRAFDEQTQGWVPTKVHARLTDAMTAWSQAYYAQFSADDGVRLVSEAFVENDRYLGYLDGLSDDRVVHEVKTTSRGSQISEQLWKVQNSIQVKLYCVLTKAKGIRIEFAYKDTPYGIYRSEVVPVTEEQLVAWEQELNALADTIWALGDDIHNYPCHPDGCCITSKNMTSMCVYQSLCDMGLTSETEMLYREKTHRK